MNKNVFLSYDYEIYFNTCDYSVSDVLIEPTYQIAQGFLSTPYRCTFFVDTEFIFACKRTGQFQVVLEIEKQLKWLISNGFDVQLHLHPLWKYALFDNGRWIFDYSFYSPSGMDKKCVFSMIKEGADYLYSLLHNYNRQYKCVAFRAGGFCLDNSFSFLNILSSNGIAYDSSICKNTFLESKYQTYNYFGKNSKLVSNCIFEIQVLTVPKLNVHYLFNHKKNILKSELRGKGSPVIYTNSRPKRLLYSMFENALLTLDTHKSTFIHKCLNAINFNNISILGHPKLENKNHVSNVLDLIAIAKKEVCFKTFLEFYYEQHHSKNN